MTSLKLKNRVKFSRCTNRYVAPLSITKYNDVKTLRTCVYAYVAVISGENNVESPDGVTEVITGFVPFHIGRFLIQTVTVIW